jgi:hypothetical protein
MFQATILDRVGDVPALQAEDSLARLGTMGVVAAGLMALLVFML